jgi:osmotically-inducible protein OsmY
MGKQAEGKHLNAICVLPTQLEMRKTMKNLLSVITALAMVSIIGCSNTGAGLKKDTEANSESAAKSTKEMTDNASTNMQDTGAATILTPKIKLALSADVLLNDSKNLIDVSSTAVLVKLDGHVTSQALKDLAEKIALKVLKDSDSKQSLENHLVVQP